MAVFHKMNFNSPANIMGSIAFFYFFILFGCALIFLGFVDTKIVKHKIEFNK